MRISLKIFLCAAALLSLSAIASGQLAYSVTDNNRDDSGFAQQFYEINLATGEGRLIQTLDDGAGSPTIRREYEGFGSSGSVLLGVSEFDTELCNTGSDPITGLAADVRIFTADGVGPQIGETCIDFGGEAAAAYNPADGWLYSIASDDNFPDTSPRSKLYRISPTTGEATEVGTGITLTATSPAGGEENPYLDGLAILPNGVAYGTEARFGATGQGNLGSLYRIFLTGPNAGRTSFVKRLFAAPDGEDTGLASLDNGTLVLLLEDSQVLFGNADPNSGPFVAPSFGRFTTPGCLTTPICQDFEGFDIPNNGAGIR
ncbi:MAG: hypothetical protein DWQ47_13005 [Acidobacteria bacterium]|nr:MAG: hypothetical protein DWQ32_00405 [Acidobacteriota bacterium]REK03000.1 MAG: hypothetical protein DWQ38_11730 [Acidobacteriota bacterium]REK13196.1 MAG: hypothetical protein DWQ43_06095 [Acidobacteriota bacterium]REK41190.1 MAG: hypothetical protein DWQ47_13005 [Acidobacteriota bacterium]